MTHRQGNNLVDEFTVGDSDYVITGEYKGFDRWKIQATKDGEKVPVKLHRDTPMLVDTIINRHEAVIVDAMKKASNFVFAQHVRDAAAEDYPIISIAEKDGRGYADSRLYTLTIRTKDTVAEARLARHRYNAMWEWLDNPVNMLYDCFESVVEQIAVQYDDKATRDAIREWGYDQVESEEE